MVGVLQGEVQFFFSSMTTSMAAIKSGRLKVLGTSSKVRLASLPDVATFQEAGLQGLDFAPWEGFIAPARTPRAVVDRLHREVVRLLKLPDVLASLAAGGSYPVGSSPDEFAAEIRHQLDLFSRVFKTAKIKRE